MHPLTHLTVTYGDVDADWRQESLQERLYTHKPRDLWWYTAAIYHIDGTVRVNVLHANRTSCVVVMREHVPGYLRFPHERRHLRSCFFFQQCIARHCKGRVD